LPPGSGANCIWCKASDGDEFDGLVYSLDTYSRSNMSFKRLVGLGVEEVRRRANGRKVWWIPCPNKEWTNVVLLFGEEAEIVDRLASLVSTVS